MSGETFWDGVYLSLVVAFKLLVGFFLIVFILCFYSGWVEFVGLTNTINQ